jgi:hypothetical protein
MAMSDAEAERIPGCRDEATLERYWERALSAASAAELLAD